MERSPVVVVWGETGTGKTVLVGKATGRLEQHGQEVVRINCKPVSETGHVVDLKQVLRLLSDDEGYRQIAAADSCTPDQLLQMAAARVERFGYRGKECILRFEDYCTYASGRLVRWVQDKYVDHLIVELAERQGSRARVVITCQAGLDFLQAPRPRPHAEALHLEKLMPDEALALLQEGNPDLATLPPDTVKAIADLTRLNPWALSPFANLSRGVAVPRLLRKLKPFDNEASKREWARRIVGCLPRAKDVQRAARVFGLIGSLPASAFEEFRTRYPVAGVLIDHGIVVAPVLGEESAEYYVHDIVAPALREALGRGAMGRVRRRQAHDDAAEVLSCARWEGIGAKTQYLARAVEHARLAGWERTKPAQFGKVLAALGRAQRSAGAFERASGNLVAAAGLARSVGDAATEVVSLLVLCHVHLLAVDRPGLRRAATRSAEVSVSRGSPQDVHNACLYVMWAHRIGAMNLAEALTVFGNALAWCVRTIEQRAAACVLANRGRTLLHAGDVDAARQVAHTVRHAAGLWPSYHPLTSFVSQLLRALGQWQAALAVSDSCCAALMNRPNARPSDGAMALATGEQGSRDQHAPSRELFQALGQKADILRHLGRITPAVAVHEQAHRIAEDLADEYQMRISHGVGGRLHFLAGEFEEADRHHREHLRLAEIAGDLGGMGWAKNGLAQTYLARGGDPREAAGLFIASAELSLAKYERRNAAEALANAAWAWSLAGEAERALPIALQAVDLAHAHWEEDSVIVAAMAEAVCARVLAALERWPEAEAHAQRAHGVYQQLNLQSHAAEVAALRQTIAEHLPTVAT